MSQRETLEDCFAVLVKYEDPISLDKLAKIVGKAQKAQESGEWKKIRLDDWYDEDDDAYHVCLVGDRQETEKEMKARLKQEKLDAQEEEKYNREREKAERELYERLKKKYQISVNGTILK